MRHYAVNPLLVQVSVIYYKRTGAGLTQVMRRLADTRTRSDGATTRSQVGEAASWFACYA